MKRYKLLKDTLTLKAGTIFEEREDPDEYKELGQVVADGCLTSPWLTVSEISNFDEWFEEIPEPKRWRGKLGEIYWFLSDNGSIYCKTDADTYIDYYRYLVGNYFKTKEEVKVYKKYLIARQVLLDDAEGGKWDEHGCNNWNAVYARNNWGALHFMSYMPELIYFQDKETLEKSLEEHEEQWKIVRKYETKEEK